MSGTGTTDHLDNDSDNDGTLDSVESGFTLTGIYGINGLDSGAESTDDYSDVNALSHSGTGFLLPDTDDDVVDDGSDASPTLRDFDWRDDMLTAFVPAPIITAISDDTGPS